MLNTQYHGNHRRVPKMNELRRKIKCFIGTRKVRHLFTADYSFATVIIHPIGTVIAQKKIILLIVSVVMVKNRNIELSTTFINLKFLCIEFKEYLTYFNELPYITNPCFDIGRIFCNIIHSLTEVLIKPVLYFYEMTSIQY